MRWVAEGLSFQVSAGSHHSSHGEFPKFTSRISERAWWAGVMATFRPVPKRQVERPTEAGSVQDGFYIMVYSSRPPCCNSQPGATHHLPSWGWGASSHEATSPVVGWGERGKPWNEAAPLWPQPPRGEKGGRT